MRLQFRYSLIILLLIVAFGLRLAHLRAGIFHIDEYISMLAAVMTAQKGAPILPSGLLYHQGLLVSYLAAPLIYLLDFKEEISRWPSLLVGMLTVAYFYRVGRRLFQSPAAGIFALTLATLDTSMILWSARMRMYALAQLLMLLALYFLIQGVLLQPSRRYRAAAVFCFIGAILTHSVAIVALPVWGLALILVIIANHYLAASGAPQGRSPISNFQPAQFKFEILIALLLLALGVGFGIAGQIPFLSPETASANSGGGGVWGVLDKFLEPGVSWQRVDDFIYYFTTTTYWPLLLLTGVSLLSVALAGVRGRITRRDLAALFLALILLLTIAELALALNHTWRKTRYLFILCQSPFLLLAADGLARFGQLAMSWWGQRGQMLTPVGIFLGTIAIVALWVEPVSEVARGQGTGSYNTAFQWVEERWQAGDRVMTVHPSAAYLYLDRSDYYATQGTARVLLDEESEELVDRYVGSQLVDSLDLFHQVVAEPGRLWFVVDVDRLFSRYEPFFIQQVFAQMDIAHWTGRILIFLSRPYPQAVPAEPSQPVQANFNNWVELGGYSLDFNQVAPDRTVQLGLYWRPLTTEIPKPYKVFVQLRVEGGQIVAQADHFIYEGFLTGATMGQLQAQQAWLIDTADLTLPEKLPAGTYQLWTGLYDPDTFERAPLLADTSGENAVLLETISIP